MGLSFTAKKSECHKNTEVVGQETSLYWVLGTEDIGIKNHNPCPFAAETLVTIAMENQMIQNALEKSPFKRNHWTSLVAQWLRISMLMQWTKVQALVQQDPICCGSTKPVGHNYWACALEPASHNYWARMPQLLKPACLEPVLRNKRSPRSPQLEKARAQQWRLKAAINKDLTFKK